jgi:hypothetical protein
MIRQSKFIAIIAALCITVLAAATRLPARGQNDEELMRARESVWRAWFADDTRTLQALVPPEAIVMSGVCDVVFVLLLEQESLFLA